MNMAAIEDYLKRPYHIEIVWSESEDGDSGWVAEVKELDGCIAQGRSHDELFENIERAMTAWIDDALQDGDPIPDPHEEPSYSGNVLVRMPPWLHRQLVSAAGREGVSLNQFAVALLANTIGPVGRDPSKRGAGPRPAPLTPRQASRA